ncbi:SpoIIE family protein phosphatase [Streptomyces sp. NPDC058653]|uniref:ATP-binding SpoIIE family protein phosphatase n=1 Tax=Streptomyces sp. NPDC058653 TaxID=3346576 RepID=UPI0036681B42
MSTPGSEAVRLARRHRVMAAALRLLHTRLGATTSTIYLPVSTGDRLSAAMSVDNSAAFTVVPGMATDDRLYSSSTAYRTGEAVVLDEGGVHELVRDDPAVLFRAPVPMVVASAPLNTSVHRLGAVTLRWSPPRPVTADVLRFLRGVAEDLARELDAQAREGLSMVAPGVPLFVPESPLAEPHGEPRVPPENRAADLSPSRPGGPPIAGSTFLYQLVQLTSALTAAIRPREVLSACWEQMARPFGASAVMLGLVDKGRLLAMGGAGFPRGTVRGIHGLQLSAPHPATDCITRVEPLFFESAEALHDRYPDFAPEDDQRAWAFLPLIVNKEAMGCGVLGFPAPLHLNSQERAFLLIMLEAVAQALVRARSHDLEHRLAQGLQQGLLPRSLPHLAEVEIAARYLPTTGGAVGGDWYDVLSLPQGGLGFVIGDVEGRGLEAAAVMGQLRSAVRAYASEGHDPASLLTRSNRLLTELDTGLFATCCCLWLDLDTGSSEIASAGHPLPLLAPQGDSATEPATSVGPPLGVEPGAMYEQTEVELPPGGIAALYSNGLPDDRSGGSPAVDWVSRRVTESFGQNLDLVAERLTGSPGIEAPRDDDAALLLLRYRGARPTTHRRVARVRLERHELQGLRRVRDALRGLAGEWNLGLILDRLELLTTEVVTNALIHADSEVDVRLRECPGGVRVEVRDSDPRPPVPVTILSTDESENRQAESGRGLLIVDAVASAWGSAPVGRGKMTWFELGVGT